METGTPEIPKWPPIDIGTVVETTAPHNEEQAGWTEEALRSRQWGRVGTVTDFHDSHGLSYEVTHRDDSTVGHYEPEELRIVD